MISSLVLTGLSLLNPLPAPPACALLHTLKLHPASGTVLRKTMTSHWSTESEEFRVFMGGQPVPSQFLPELQFSSSTELETTLVDSYGETKQGVLLGFQRSYELLGASGEWSVEVPPETSEGGSWDRESELMGETVEFLWDTEQESFGRELAAEESSFDDLDLLTGQFDLVALLPDSAVRAGDHWKADGVLLAHWLSPAGDLGLERRPQEPTEKFKGSEMTGELELTLTKVEKVDGVMIASIQVEGSFERIQVRSGDLSRVPVADGAATDTVTARYELAGEFQWNVEAGHAVGITLGGSLEMVLVTVKDPGQEGPEYSSELDSSGEFHFSLGFAPVSDS
jgi:hypothetical protein